MLAPELGWGSRRLRRRIPPNVDHIPLPLTLQALAATNVTVAHVRVIKICKDSHSLYFRGILKIFQSFKNFKIG
jgi:hypothetical protein